LDALALKIVSGEVREGDRVSVEVKNDEIAVIAPARQTLRRPAKVAV
jgi:antitoxin component of MazEF toxin-antitoxin module